MLARLEPRKDKCGAGASMMTARCEVLCSVGQRRLLNVSAEARIDFGPEGRFDCWVWKQATAPEGPFQAVSLGTRHSCGIRPDGMVECWGSNYGVGDYETTLVWQVGCFVVALCHPRSLPSMPRPRQQCVQHSMLALSLNNCTTSPKLRWYLQAVMVL